MKSLQIISALVFATMLVRCASPQSGPDKSIGGSLLGAAWGAGAGAVIGNQVGSTGPGAAVGAGFGAAAGMVQGAVMDVQESGELDQEKQLAELKISNEANERELQNIQNNLDIAATRYRRGTVLYQVPFDALSSSLRLGAVANLEVIADQLRRDPAAAVITVSGHADDEGSPDENERLAEARARAVGSYLGSRGISMNQIIVKSFGSTRPLLSNNTPEGREMNRRVDIIIGHAS